MEAEDKCIQIQTSPSRNKQLIVENTVYSSAYDFDVTDEELKKAYKELNEIENERENCIKNLREKLLKENNLQYRTDDHYLLCYLRYRKFDCNKAYNTILKSHAMKVNYPKFYTLPPNLEFLLDRGFVSLLPYRDDKGRIILTANFSKWKLEEMSFEEIMQCSNAFLDIISMNPHNQINGIVGLWNLQGLTAQHITHFISPTLMWNLANLLQDTLPNRTKLVLLVNCNKLMLGAYKAVQLFLKKKIANRIKMIGPDVTEIHKYLSPAILPKEYGGTLEESECSVTKHIMDNLCYLKYSRSFISVLDSELD